VTQIVKTEKSRPLRESFFMREQSIEELGLQHAAASETA
jgi:hypothetical protein